MVLLRACVAILLACLTAPAWAGGLPPPPTALDAAGPDARLSASRVFVQLVVNERLVEGFVPVDVRDGQLLLAADELRRAGVAVTGPGAVDLSACSDLRGHYEPLEQKVYLSVDLALLAEARLRGPARARVHAAADTGAAFNYDLYVQRNGGSSMASLYSEQRVFGRLGMFSTGGTLRVGSRGAGVRNGYLRYDTRFRYIDQEHAIEVTAGDLVTASLPWSTSVRLGGIQVGRNFATRPDLVTTPLPSFAGQAAVPSAVDLFIDGYRQSRTTVEPGRFVLNDMPVVNGAGRATIVTTDAVGRQVATTIPFYVSASLLRPGLTDFSAEVGMLRQSYGLRSFDYGAAAASFIVRRGMSERLTLSAHGEASRSLALGSGGIDWSPGLWGSAHVTLSATHSKGQAGSQMTVGYDYSGKRFTIAAEHRRTSRDFRDLGNFDLARIGDTSKRTSTRLVASTQLSRWGNVGLGYIDARSRGFRTRLLSASWSMPVGGRISAFASADYDLRRHAASGQVRVIVPFGRASASGGVTAASGRGLRTDATFDMAVPTSGGFGLSAGGAIDDRSNVLGQATARYRTRLAEFEAGASTAGGDTSVWADASGALIAMGGGIFAANDAPSSFAVVDTGDVAGVPVTYENQPIGKTDAKGRLFIRDVTAYHPGRIAIDPLALDVGMTTAKIETNFAVVEGAGAIVHLPIRRTRSVTASLVDELGQAIVAGSLATLPDGRTMPIGWDGILYFADLPGTVTLDVRRNDGGTCRAILHPAASTQGLANLGAVPCT